MIITLSPAKILDFKSPSPIEDCTQPIYKKEAIELNHLLQELSIDEIAELMKINPSLTMQVHEYIQTFELDKVKEKQAVFAFNGIAYQGLDPDTLSSETLDFAQEHLITLSGLYGILRPLDLIKPYRLEMGRAVKNPKGNMLYDYWRDTVTQHMSKKLLADDNVWVNLTSSEYAKVVDKKNLPKDCQIVIPQFKETNGNKFKQIVVYTKKARGMMTRFIIENKLTDVEHLKAFDYEGYTFSPQLSNKRDWIFIR